jgi:hypothetical protein
MQQYESVIILTPLLSEDAAKETIARRNSRLCVCLRNFPTPPTHNQEWQSDNRFRCEAFPVCVRDATSGSAEGAANLYVA